MELYEKHVTSGQKEYYLTLGELLLKGVSSKDFDKEHNNIVFDLYAIRILNTINDSLYEINKVLNKILKNNVFTIERMDRKGRIGDKIHIHFQHDDIEYTEIYAGSNYATAVRCMQKKYKFLRLYKEDKLYSRNHYCIDFRRPLMLRDKENDEKLEVMNKRIKAVANTIASLGNLILWYNVCVEDLNTLSKLMQKATSIKGSANYSLPRDFDLVTRRCYDYLILDEMLASYSLLGEEGMHTLNTVLKMVEKSIKDITKIDKKEYGVSKTEFMV